MFLGTFAVLALGVANPGLREAALDPGPLLAAHASAAEGCADCHAATTPGAWVREAVARLSGEAEPHAGGRRCLECHDVGPDPWRAHGVADQGSGAGGTRTLTQRAARAVFGEAPRDVACASCHVEHQGRHVDLSAASDARCQACHETHFADFAQGHPELGVDFGQRSAERVRFDHVAHLGLGVVPAAETRFAKKGQREVACSECHSVDARGRHVVLRDHVFERWCAECHSGAELAPLKVLRFPAAPVAWLGSASLPPWSLRLEREPDLDPQATQPLPLQRALLRNPWDGPKSLLALAERFQEYALEPIEEGSVSTGAWDGGVSQEMRVDLWESEAAAQQAASEEALWRDPARSYLRDTAQLLEELSEGRVGPRWRPRERARAKTWVRAWPQELLGRVRRAWLSPGRAEAELEVRQPGAGTWKVAQHTLSYGDYRHGDAFLRAWLELAGDRGRGRVGLHLRATQGRCDTCHVVTPRTRWRARWEPDEQPRGYFDHAAHEAQVEGCTSCHAPREEVEGQGDFRLLGYATREDCAGCHTPAKAGSRCTQCHDYHPGGVR